MKYVCWGIVHSRWWLVNLSHQQSMFIYEFHKLQLLRRHISSVLYTVTGWSIQSGSIHTYPRKFGYKKSGLQWGSPPFFEGMGSGFHVHLHNKMQQWNWWGGGGGSYKTAFQLTQKGGKVWPPTISIDYCIYVYILKWSYFSSFCP